MSILHSYSIYLLKHMHYFFFQYKRANYWWPRPKPFAFYVVSVIKCFWNTSSLALEPLVLPIWKSQKAHKLFKCKTCNKLEYCYIMCLSPEKYINLCWHWIQNKIQKCAFSVLLDSWPLFEFETKLYQTTEFTL